MKEEGQESDLVGRITDDAAFGLSAEDVVQLMDPSRFTGRSAEQVDRFLERWVHPVLERHGAAVEERLGTPTVRV
jgi:adenylosuccinate lyase